MGSIPEDVDCYNDRQTFDPSSFDQRFYQATSMDAGGLQTLATSHPPASFMPINVDPAQCIANYNFTPQQFTDMHSTMLPGTGNWQAAPTNFGPAAPWAMQQSGLQLQTEYPPGVNGTQARHELVSPADTVRRSSYSAETAANPSQSTESGSRSPRKRSKAKAVGADTPKKHKRNKTNSEEVALKGSESDQDMDLADLADLADLPEEGDHKREKFLARNRVAASKCRQKKKEWTKQLEDKARDLSSQQSYLTATVNMLRNELLELKCRCLEHHDCDCDQIRDYLKSTVASLKPALEVYNDSSSLNSHTRGSSTSMISGSMSEHSLGSPMNRSDTFGSFAASPALAKRPGKKAISMSTADSPDHSFVYGADPRLSPQGLDDDL